MEKEKKNQLDNSSHAEKEVVLQTVGQYDHNNQDGPYVSGWAFSPDVNGKVFLTA